MKNIIKKWLKDHQIELPDERIDILITMLKSEPKGEIEITTFCNSGCDCPYCHTGEDDARDVEKCIYCQNNWANEEHNRLVKIAIQQERERIIERVKKLIKVFPGHKKEITKIFEDYLNQ